LFILLLVRYSLEKYNELKSQYDSKINNLKLTFSEITLQTELLKKEKEKEMTLSNIYDVVLSEDTFNQTLSNLLIDKVFVYPDKKVEIEWKVRGFI